MPRLAKAGLGLSRHTRLESSSWQYDGPRKQLWRSRGLHLLHLQGFGPEPAPSDTDQCRRQGERSATHSGDMVSSAQVYVFSLLEYRSKLAVSFLRRRQVSKKARGHSRPTGSLPDTEQRAAAQSTARKFEMRLIASSLSSAERCSTAQRRCSRRRMSVGETRTAGRPAVV